MENNKEQFQRSLFQGFQLPEPTQAEVIESLSPHLVYLWHSIIDPWEELQRYRETDKNFADLTENEVAQWLTIQSSHRAQQFLDTKPGFRAIRCYGKLVILFEDRFAITIKKLTRRMNPETKEWEITRSNYLTRRQRKYWSQQRDARFPNVPRVILGYMLRKEITEIRIYIAYPRSKSLRVEWAYRVPNQVSITQAIPKIASQAHEEPKKGFVITPVSPAHRDNRDKETGAEWKE